MELVVRKRRRDSYEAEDGLSRPKDATTIIDEVDVACGYVERLLG